MSSLIAFMDSGTRVTQKDNNAHVSPSATNGEKGNWNWPRGSCRFESYRVLHFNVSRFTEGQGKPNHGIAKVGELDRNTALLILGITVVDKSETVG